MTERRLPLLALTVLLPGAVFASESNPCGPFTTDGPAAVTAVAPRFPDIAVQARVSTSLEICVAVGPDGVPLSAVLDPPFRIMQPATEAAALLWRFEPAPHAQEVRHVRLRFVFRLIDKAAPPAEETSLFRPPYEVEVRHVRPDDVLLRTR